MLLVESGKNMLREMLAPSYSPGIHLGRAGQGRAFSHEMLTESCWFPWKAWQLYQNKRKSFSSLLGAISSRRGGLGFPFLSCQQSRSTMEIVCQAGDKREAKLNLAE